MLLLEMTEKDMKRHIGRERSQLRGSQPARSDF